MLDRFDRLSAPNLNPAKCEQYYNARDAVPRHDMYFKRWPQWALQARGRLPSRELNLAYGRQYREVLDWFPAPHSRGVFVFLHGGYWLAFSKDEFSWVAQALVQQGISVAVLSYPLCPDHNIGEITDSVRWAIAWLYYNQLTAKERANLVVGGHSAGGHMVASLYATDWELYGLPAQVFAGGLAISGLFDLVPLVYTSYGPRLGLQLETAQAWSPLAFEPTQRGTLIAAVGSEESTDGFRDQSLRLAAAWPTVAEAHLIDGCHHFSVVEQLADPNSPLFRLLIGLYR